jgi:hypothetical protein
VLLRPERLEHLDHLVGLLAAPPVRHAKQRQLLFPPADADAADQPAAGEHVDGAEHLRHDHRVPVPQDEDGAAEPGVLGDAGDGGEGDDRFQVRHVGWERKRAARVLAGLGSGEDDVVAGPE